MPAEMIPASANVAGGMRSRKYPLTKEGPWDMQQETLEIGNSNSIVPTTTSADPRCQCVPPYDPRTQVK